MSKARHACCGHRRTSHLILQRLAAQLVRCLVAGAIGIVLGVGALVASYARQSTITFEMDRGAPGIISGLYNVERAGDETFAWTHERVTMDLPGLDRRVEWSCVIRMRGGRADPSTLPEVTVSIDGVIAAVHSTRNEYQDVEVTLPPRPQRSGGTLILTASNTFVPGASDRRSLGVMLDRIACNPASDALVRPPNRALLAAATGGGAFGAAFALVGAPALAVLAAASLLAIAQAAPLGSGVGVFGDYPGRAAWLAAWIALLLVVSVRAVEWARGRPLTAAARAVSAVAAAVLYLKLLALLHPAKLPIDIIFHAHRLQWVLDGRFYFTQPMPSGVRFPYAIGLYVFAAPWTLLTSDYALLLRIVVCAAEALGAVLAYLLISRVWHDRGAGVLAATLFHLVPRTYGILGSANMTNGFGQSVAFVVLSAAVLWPLGRGRWREATGLTVITAFALLSHISVFTTLGVILGSLALLYWWRGGPELRRPAVVILGSLVVAGVVSIAVYYGHFGDAYRSAARVSAASASGETAGAGAVGGTAPGPSRTPGATLTTKVTEAGRLTVEAIGWPMLLLAIAGVVPFWQRGVHDRLSMAVAALGMTFAAFAVAVVLAPVERSFQRYAAEFLTRITLATYPAAVMLAGLGAAAIWRTGWTGRIVSAALLIAAVDVGIELWIEWFA